MFKRSAAIFAGVFCFLSLCAMLMGASTKITAPLQLKLITPGASILSPGPRALYFAADGTVSITNQDDSTVAAVPVFAGTTMQLQPKKITAATGAVYGYYD